MNYYINDIKLYQVFLYIGFGFFLFFIFKLIKGYVFPLLTNKESSIKKNWLRIQIVIWFLFSTAFFVALLKLNTYTTLTFLVIILGLGWNHWRNIFSGIVIKFNKELAIGETITTNFVTGTLSKIGFAETRLINSNGEIISIPNFKLKNSVLKKISKLNNSTSITIQSSLTTQEIYNQALVCPYISGNNKIEVKAIENNQFVIKITLIDALYKDDVMFYFENQER